MIEEAMVRQMMEAMTAIRSYAANMRVASIAMRLMMAGMPDGPVKGPGTEMANAYDNAAGAMDVLADSIRKLAESKP